jgi:hypothetical protein
MTVVQVRGYRGGAEEVQGKRASSKKATVHLISPRALAFLRIMPYVVSSTSHLPSFACSMAASRWSPWHCSTRKQPHVGTTTSACRRSPPGSGKRRSRSSELASLPSTAVRKAMVCTCSTDVAKARR